ncbi:hypothetical protein [Leptolyngbya ohadii]|uniref:hypothetical protein n=1 Tax=Leptolyngbya ohadii TaxID=1962290 RepID=UPI0015C590F6|nr:hypothetical protein [Leptolyngbya ohadii]
MEANANVIISREQLAQFLTISERAVYPLAFDRQTWLVVLYEGEEYAGYQFRVQR